ncbi:xylan 1,4-beta-xylosidase [Microtetraspora sp. AC03309]|uniref:xylan 1,4-beta-xylosidase n=1 Tax=Microtetraspora sp. AC03309 TaxID=2779376 RepID=UPI001E4719D3|nr:xylan 1,4-beta-xylosidase [Microtetraspora sp. AC03309]MCC5578606.1 xylan 1,4-beta-xylosidase [Microtetraspora sp. AC03309]
MAAILGGAAARRSGAKPTPRPAVAVAPLSFDQARTPERWPRWGMTHTQYSVTEDGPAAAERAREALGARAVVQNQHIMGFGAGNPEPKPGEYDFSSLDERVRLMVETGAAPVITLCCAPDWMKGGRSGDTDWSLLEIAPRHEHFPDFARLAAAMARRYPNVRHFIVWNEFKGFWDGPRREWNAAAYTELYNQVYDALKAVNPEIKVGGPYVPVASRAGDAAASEVAGPWGSVDRKVLKAVDYWLRHKRGADFVVVDGGVTSEDGRARPDEFTALGKFGAMTRWLRGHSDLPVWWAEFYPLPCASLEPGGSCPALTWDERRRTAVTAVALIELAESGADTALYWDTHRPKTRDCPLCLWSGDDGAPTESLALLQDFARWFPEGTELVAVDVSVPQVRVLARDGRMVVVNTTDGRLAARVDGGAVTLEPYEVRWMDR